MGEETTLLSPGNHEIRLKLIAIETLGVETMDTAQSFDGPCLDQYARCQPSGTVLPRGRRQVEEVGIWAFQQPPCSVHC